MLDRTRGKDDEQSLEDIDAAAAAQKERVEQLRGFAGRLGVIMPPGTLMEVAELGTPPIDPATEGYTHLDHSYDLTRFLDHCFQNGVSADEMGTDRVTYLRAGFTHDLGKIGDGSAEYTPRQNPIIRFFNINFGAYGINSGKTSLHKALEIAVEKEFVTRDDSLEILRSAISENCDPFKMTLRQYLNLHARWGGRRAKRDGLPRANQRIAAHHHSLNREQDNSEPESPEDTAKLVELLEIGDKAVAHMFRSHEQWRSSESVIASIRESIEECTDTLVRNAALTLMNRYNTLFIEALDTIKEARARVKRVGETSTNPRKSP